MTGDCAGNAERWSPPDPTQPGGGGINTLLLSVNATFRNVWPAWLGAPAPGPSPRNLAAGMVCGGLSVYFSPIHDSLAVPFC